MFRDLQDTVRREASEMNKVLGDEMEKGGKDAGKRAAKGLTEEISKGSAEAGNKAGKDYAGKFESQLRTAVKNAQREIDSIDFSTASANTLRDLDRVKKKLKDMASDEYDITLDTKRAIHDVQHLEGVVARLVKGDHELNIEANLQSVLKDLQVVSKIADEVAKKKRDITFGADFKPAERAMGAFEAKLRASAKAAASSLGDTLNPEIKKIRKELEAVADSNIGIDITTGAAREKVAALSAEIKALAINEDIEIDIRANAMSAFTDLVGINALGTELDGKHWEVSVGLDAKTVERDMGAFERKVRDAARNSQKNLDGINPALARIKSALADIGNPDITPDLNSEQVVSEMRGLAAKLKVVATDTELAVDIRTNAAAAFTELVPLMKAFSAIDGKKLHVEVDLDAGAAAAKAGLLRSIFLPAKGGADEAANSFRSFNFVVLAVASTLPALVPILGAVGGGLLALIPILGAVGAGLGVMLAGFSGIGSVVKGFGDVQKSAGEEARVAGKRIQSAARGIADAERNLTRARQSAAQANADAARSVGRAQEQAAKQVKDALESQRDAEQNLADAQRDARKAQDNLREARKKAQEELEAARDNRAQNALDVRQGVVDVFNATVLYNSVMADGSSTNLDKETADIGLQQSRLDLKEARDEQAKLAEEKKKQDKEGVNGTSVVQNAQEALTAALDRQRDAQEALGDAAEAVREARIEGARAIADAVRNQQRTEASGAQAVEDAQRSLTQAHEDYAAAVDQTSASVRNLNDQLNKIGPAGEKFARFIFGLRDEAYGLRDAIQSAMLPGVQSGLQQIINTYGPQFQDFAARMGGVIGRLFNRAGQGLGEEPWRAFFETYSKLAPKLMDDFGRTTGNWMGVFVRLFTIAAPLADKFSDALLRLSEKALDYVQSAKGTKAWSDFFDYVGRVGPKVVDFFWSMFLAAKAIVIALAPLGETLLGLFSGLFDWIAGIDPKILGFIVVALIGLVIAFQLAVGVTALFAAGAAAFATPASIVILALVAIGGAVYAAYLNFKGFRNFIDRYVIPALKLLWIWFKFVWKVTVILWTSIWKAVKWAAGLIRDVWVNILWPVFKAIGAIVTWLWKNIIYPIFRAIWTLFSTIARGMWWIWKNILFPVFDLFGSAIRILWNKAVKPIFGWIADRFKWVGDRIKWVWDKAIKPVFDAFKDKVLPALRTAFSNVTKWIADKWAGLKELLAAPIRFVIDKVINGGIIKGFNWVAEKVGSSPMKPIPMPEGLKGKARGGTIRSGADYNVYPGYTPGKDIGYIGISGGEAIMRPEWTRAIGEENIARMNYIARTRGASGLERQFAGGFAGGGVVRDRSKSKVVWPVPGRDTGTYSGHNGVDINRGSGSDDYGDPIWAFRSGHITYVGSGRGYGSAIMQSGAGYPEVVYGHTSAQYVRSGQKVDAGQLIGRVGSTGNSTAPHLHFGRTSGGTFENAMALLRGANMSGGGGGISIPGWVKDIISAPAKWIANRVKEPIANFMEKFGDSGITKAVIGVGKKLFGGVGEKIKDMAQTFKEKLQSAASNAWGMTAIGAVVNAIKGGGSVRDDVRAVAAAYGWDKGKQWAALDDLINRESSWNPNADNPTSSAAGLFQKMTSIHGPLEKTVTGQAKWGLNYIANRYGTPSGAISFHNSHGYYRDGGVVPDSPAGVADNGTMMYDKGGYLPPGLTQVLNMTGKPEPVFTPDQFARMGQDGLDVHYEPHFHKSDLTARDVAFDLDVEFRRLGRTSSRYSGKS